MYASGAPPQEFGGDTQEAASILQDMAGQGVQGNYKLPMTKKSCSNLVTRQHFHCNPVGL